MKTNPMFDTGDGFVSLPLADVQAMGFDQINATFSFKPISLQQQTHLETMPLVPVLNAFLSRHTRLQLRPHKDSDGNQWVDLRDFLPLKLLYGFRKNNCSILKLIVKSKSNEFPYLHAVWNNPRYSEAIAGPAVIDHSIARRIRKELKHTSKKSQSNLILKYMVRHLGGSPTDLLNTGLAKGFDQLLTFIRSFLESVPALSGCEIAVDIESVEAMLDLLMPNEVTSHGAVQSLLQKSLQRVKDLSGFKISSVAGNNSSEDRPLTMTYHDQLDIHQRSFDFKTYSKGSFDGTSHLRGEFKDKKRTRLGVFKNGSDVATALKDSRSWKNILTVYDSFSKRLDAKLKTEDVAPTITLIERILREANLSKREIRELLRGESLDVQGKVNRTLLRACCDFRTKTSFNLKPSLLTIVFGELVGRERFDRTTKLPYKKATTLANKPTQFNKALHLAQTLGVEHVTAKNMRSQHPSWNLGKTALYDFIREFHRWWADFTERPS